MLNLIIPIKKIKKLEKIYSNNFLRFNTFEEFEREFSEYFKILRNSLSGYKEFEKQFLSKKSLQPCILTECFVSQTIANALQLNKFVDLDANPDVPAMLTSAIYRSSGYTDGSTFRYAYYNQSCDTVLFQCGASRTIDVVFTKYNISIRIEIKEQVARLEECDVIGGYSEDGKLIITQEFSENRADYVPYIEIFNKKTNIFEIEGHNFKIVNYLHDDEVRELISNSLGVRVLDMFLFIVGNDIVPVLPNHLLNFVSFEGSEIRSAGKNSYKIFTLQYAKRKIQSLGGRINNDIVTMPFSDENIVWYRGRKTRYGVGPFLSVKIDKVSIENGQIKFKFSDLKQKKPCISIHLNAYKNEQHLQLEFNELNS